MLTAEAIIAPFSQRRRSGETRRNLYRERLSVRIGRALRAF
jgi:hypothetical protein